MSDLAQFEDWYMRVRRWYALWRHDAGLQDQIIPTQAERWRAVAGVKPGR